MSRVSKADERVDFAFDGSEEHWWSEGPCDTARARMYERSWRDVGAPEHAGAFALLCALMWARAGFCICVFDREREREVAAVGTRGPRGSRRRQTQLDASRGGQDVLTASRGRLESRSASRLQLMWMSLTMAQHITSPSAVINTFQGFVEG